MGANKMTKSNKKDAEVLAAEKAEEEAMIAWKAAESEAWSAEQNYYAARRASKEARIKADETLPQCKMVIVGGWTGEEKDDGNAAILKVTPSGQLVVRRVGDHDRNYRFRLDKYTGSWRQVARYATRELRDVPAEYLPQRGRK